MRFSTALLVGCLLALSTATPAAATEPGFHLELVAGEYKKPLYVAAHSNDDFLYVVEQRGVIRVLERDDPSSPWVKAGVFLDMRNLVGGPLIGRGLLGLVFHPDYDQNGRFYVFYTRRSDNKRRNGDIVIAEYRRTTHLRADPGSRRRVLLIEHPNNYHFGGWMGFGPDGYLYVTTGDPPGVDYGQDKTSRLGKILRFNPTKRLGRAGFVPGDNPFVGKAGDDLIWAYGLRNPWRASFDRVTGDLWVSDPGELYWEEVNRFSPYGTGKGKFLGWSVCEGSHAYPQPEVGPQPCSKPAAVAPVLEYAHADGRCSVIGGYVYRGIDQPSLVGRYVFGDYCTGEIWTVASDHASGDPLDAPFDSPLLITSFGDDARGEIYVTARNGTVWQVVED